VESNLEQQTPKLPKINVTNVSSAVFGKDGPALGKESKIGKLARIVRTTRIKVNTIEKILPEHQEVIGSTAKKVFINAKKITSIKNTLQNQKSKIGEKLPGSNKDNKNNFNKTLVETNKILVEIQKQLANDFAMQVAEQKSEKQQEQKESSREKLKAEESALEKGRKRIGAALANTTKKVLSPFKGIFDQIKEFVLTVGAGIAVNAAFKWLSNEENRKKMEDAFSFIKNNWKWIAGVAAGLFLMGPIIGIVSSIISVGTILFTIGSFLFGLLGAPALLTLLGIITAAGGIIALSEFIKNKSAGGSGFRAAIESNNQTLMDAGVGMKSSPLSKEAPLFRENPEGGYFNMVKQGVDQRTGQYGNLTTGSINPETGQTYATEQQIEAFKSWEKRNKILTKEKDAMYAEIDKARDTIITEREFLTRRPTSESQVDEFNEEKQRIKLKYQQRYIEKYGDPTFGGMFNPFENLNPETRRMGGHVRGGMPYIVGDEKGLDNAEIFVPEVNGVILSNAKTKALLASGSGKRGRIRTITLPPEIIEGAKAQTQMPLSIGEATKEPRISSTNPMDGSRSATSGIYGIMV